MHKATDQCLGKFILGFGDNIQKVCRYSGLHPSGEVHSTGL